MMDTAREWLANKISTERQKAISFAPEIPNAYFGSGIATNQPSHDTLLQESVGVADICTRAIANRIATLVPEVKTSVRTTEGKLEDQTLDDHVLKELLDRPHANFTRQQLLRLTAQSIVTVGEAYWLKIANGFSLPGALQPMPAQSVEPIVKDGVISQYHVREGDGHVLTLEAQDVIRFWFPDPETLYLSEGYLGPNAVATDASRFAHEHLRSHFQHDATPTTMFQGSSDAVVPSDPQWKRYQEDAMRKFNRRDGTHRGAPMLVPPGWEAVFAALQTGQDITPLLDHWQMNQLMNYGVPASILGRVVSGDRSSAETNQWVFDKYAILPIAMMIADGITSQLAGEFDEKIFVDFEQFVSNDKDFNLAQEKQDLELKVRSPQQVLEQRGDDPAAAKWGEYPVGTFGDVPYKGEDRDPFNVSPFDSTAIDEDEPEDDDEPEAADTDAPPRGFSTRRGFSIDEVRLRVMAREEKFRPRLEKALRGIFEAQRRAAQKTLKELTPRTARSMFSELLNTQGWGDLFDIKALAIIEQAYIYAAREELELLGGSDSFNFTAFVAHELATNGGDMIQYVNATTQKRLAKKVAKVLEEGVLAGDPTRAIAKAINEVFNGRKQNANTIARTELHRASTNAQMEAFAQAKVPWKQWVDQRDDRVRDEHEQSRIAPVRRNEMFLVDGYPASGPGDPTLPPHLSVNCRCSVRPLYVDPAGIAK